MKRAFPTSTRGRYIPGVGTTLTKANIALAVKEGTIITGESAERVAFKLTLTNSQRSTKFAGQTPPEARHVARTGRVMNGGS